jgi:hypothetical protein
VEQEATDELVDIEAHDLLLATVRVVSIAEGDTALLEAQDAMVRDRDAMGVGAEVGEHALGSRKGRLGVDDPIDAPKLAAKRGNGGVLGELAAFEGLAETIEELGGEHLGQGAHGEEEALVTRCDEALPVHGQSASRDHAVQMWMEREVLAPGMQDGGDAERASGLGREVAGIPKTGGFPFARVVVISSSYRTSILKAQLECLITRAVTRESLKIAILGLVGLPLAVQPLIDFGRDDDICELIRAGTSESVEKTSAFQKKIDGWLDAGVDGVFQVFSVDDR